MIDHKSDKVKSVVNRAKGEVKDQVGNIKNDTTMQAKGKKDKAKGQAQDAVSEEKKKEKDEETKTVLFAKFPQDSQAYEALSQLKQRSTSDQHTVFQAAVIEKGLAGDLQFKDGFTTEEAHSNEWFKGGFLGAVIGIIGGPLGVLLGGGIGSLIGATVTGDKIEDQGSVLENSLSDIDANNPFIIALVDETDQTMLNNLFKDIDLGTIIRRKDAGEVAQAIQEAKGS